MRILWSWLTELVEITESPEAVAEKLTRAGLEVEGLTSYRRLPEALDTLRVGRIEKIEKHPAADRLWVCQVAVGEGRPRTLVTGATNIREGDRVPVALPGSQVYGQGRWISLEARTIRGIQSEGMLCSAQEMGLGSDAEGIYLLPPDAPIGAPVSAVLGDYTDQILEISPTPNRGDALSHWGIAREYAALTAAPLRPPAWNLHGERFDFPLRLEVTDPEACPRYGGLYIRGLTPGQTTPDWIRFRLEAAGLRPIHPVVDVTNYILLGWGQPLHAFDGEKLAGRTLRIGPLTASQSMVGLQGQELSLEPGDLVIADQEGPACLAGLLGGLRTAISDETREVFLESAYFAPAWIRRTGRRLHLHTESGYRFMRGTDPDRVPWAAEAAAALIQQIYPTATVSQYAEVHDPERTAPRRFQVSLADLRRLTGLDLPPDKTRERLKRLDIAVHPDSTEIWEVAVPRYRLDVTRPVDLAEELLRLEGWEALPTPLYQKAVPYPTLSEEDKRYELQEALSEALTGMGFWEVRTPSLVSRNHFPPGTDAGLRLSNPLYEELAYLRPTMIGSGLEVLAHNRAHGAVRFWAFEWGRIYQPEGEEERLALWGWGSPPIESLGTTLPTADYFLAAVRACLRRAGLTWQEASFTEAQGVWAWGVRFLADQKELGVAGAVSVAYLQRFGLATQTVWAAELPLHFWAAPPRRLPQFRGLSYHPLVIKDLSVFVPEGLSYADLEQAFWQMGYPYLRAIQPFDKYVDASGRLSYGFRFTLQADHTLTESEIQDFLRQAIQAAERLGAVVRKPEDF